MIRELIRTWGPAVLAVIVIRTFIFEPYRIPSGSMVPTLLIGDHVLVSKFSYGVWVPFARKELVDLGDPERGDVIVFRYPKNPRLTYIKRVVGVPGDRIRVTANQVYVDGEPQDRTLSGTYEFVNDRCDEVLTRHYIEDLGGLKHHILTNTSGGGLLANYPEIAVPEDHVFVMGDNRDHSEDSRRWGFVRYDEIKGKAHFVWFSWNSCEGRIGKIRTSRFFRGLYRN